MFSALSSSDFAFTIFRLLEGDGVRVGREFIVVERRFIRGRLLRFLPAGAFSDVDTSFSQRLTDL